MSKYYSQKREVIEDCSSYAASSYFGVRSCIILLTPSLRLSALESIRTRLSRNVERLESGV